MGTSPIRPLLIFSLMKILCGDDSLSSQNNENNSVRGRLKSAQPSESPTLNGLSDSGGHFLSSKDLPMRVRRHSRIWYGSDGIAPPSLESTDRDDCERPQDWVGFQEDPYDLEEFTSSNLRRRSVNDEITSFDRCKQCDELFPVKPDPGFRTSVDLEELARDSDLSSIKTQAKAHTNSSYSHAWPHTRDNFNRGHLGQLGPLAWRLKLAGDTSSEGLRGATPEETPDAALPEFVIAHSHSRRVKRRRSEKKRKKHKMDRKTLKINEPLIEALYEEAKKNEEAIKILTGAEELPKYSSASSRNFKNSNPPLNCKTPHRNPNKPLTTNHKAKQNVFKRSFPATRNSLKAVAGGNLMFPEIFANPIVFPTPFNDDDDDESVTVKVYESAVRRGNNSFFSDLRFVPNGMNPWSRFKPTYDRHFRFRNSSSGTTGAGGPRRSPGKTGSPKTGLASVEELLRLVEGGKSGRSVSERRLESRAELVEDRQTGGAIRIRKSNNESKYISSANQTEDSKLSVVELTNETSPVEANGTIASVADTILKKKSEQVDDISESKALAKTKTSNSSSTEVAEGRLKTGGSDLNISSETDMSSKKGQEIEDKPVQHLTETKSMSGNAMEKISHTRKETFVKVEKKDKSEVNDSSKTSPANQTAIVVNSDALLEEKSRASAKESKSKPAKAENELSVESRVSNAKSLKASALPPLYIELKEIALLNDSNNESKAPASEDLIEQTNEIIGNNSAKAVVISASNSSTNNSVLTTFMSKNASSQPVVKSFADDSGKTELDLEDRDVEAQANDDSQTRRGDEILDSEIKNAGPNKSLEGERKRRMFEIAFHDLTDSEEAQNIISSEQSLVSMPSVKGIRSPSPTEDNDEFEGALSSGISSVELQKSDDTIPSESRITEYNENLRDFSKGLECEPADWTPSNLVVPEELPTKKLLRKRSLLPVPPRANGNGMTEFQTPFLGQTFGPGTINNENPYHPGFGAEAFVSPTGGDNPDRAVPLATIKTYLRPMQRAFNPPMKSPTSGLGFGSPFVRQRGDDLYQTLPEREEYLNPQKPDSRRIYSENDDLSAPIWSYSEPRINENLIGNIGSAGPGDTRPFPPDTEPHQKIQRSVKHEEINQSTVNGKHTKTTMNIFVNPPNLKESAASRESNFMVQSHVEKSIFPPKIERVSISSKTASSSNDLLGPMNEVGGLDMKFKGILSGKVPSRLVNTILAKVNGSDKMGSELGLGMTPSSSYESIDDLTMPSNEREKEVKMEAEKTMMLITKQLTQLIQETSRKPGCYTLNPDLLNFLRWLLKPASKRDE